MQKHYTVLSGRILTPDRTFIAGEKVSGKELADAGISDKLQFYVTNGALEALETYTADPEETPLSLNNDIALTEHETTPGFQSVADEAATLPPRNQRTR